MNGDWTRWFFPGESVAVNTRTKQRVDLRDVDAGEYHPALFAAGVLAWIDPDENVHVFNLATRATRVVGKVGPPRRAIQLPLTSEFVAWMDAADRVHLLPPRRARPSGR